MVEQIEVETPDGTAEAYLARPESTPKGGVLVYMDATGPLATHGYCMGARLAVRTAGRFPDEFVAVGGFHGGGLVTADAASPHTCIAGTRAEYYFGHADHDRSMTPENVADLSRALDDAGVTYTNLIYPDAPHGYTMADTSSYQEAGTHRHFTDLEALYARTMA